MPRLQAPPETLREMEKCARALARSVQYVGAATVEYLYDLETCKYYFLELNPRLQVLQINIHKPATKCPEFLEPHCTVPIVAVWE